MQYSLRKTLIRRLTISFAFSLLLLIPLIYQLIHLPASHAYDQDVSDDTRSLIPFLKISNGIPHFDISPEAEQVLKTDSRDQVYFLVLGPGNRFLAGDPGLPVPRMRRPAGKPLMYNAEYRGNNVRASAIEYELNGQKFLFITAETVLKRDILTRDSIIVTLLSAVTLIIVSTVNVWYSTSHALVPLNRIRSALQSMQQSNLEPLDEKTVPAEIRPLVQEFNGLLRRLDKSVEVQQRFVANAAHQLRTPLAGVRTQLELLRDSDDGMRDQRLTQSIAAIDRLSHLVHQMLALISSTPGGREVSVQTLVNIADVIRERSTEWVRAADVRSVDLGFELYAAQVYGDALLIGEMIANLVDNAQRYSPIGATVTIRCDAHNGHAVIEVEDDGPGIPPEECSLVFERFYRRAASANIAGSGLGLSIVREVVQGLGGTVSIGTPPRGRGCLVRVEVPQSEAETLAANANA
ncbi:MAG TPA: sensor histidine kinase [Oxalicibacterium sp.]|jgi:two-component system sensor histidine kinase TctE|nr:sensor histidine kinase [Oxalicibacterium sp.]